MVRYKQSADRMQTMITPFCFDDLIPPDAEVRAIELIVQRMDIRSLGFTHSSTKQTGRMPYDPVDMMGLYVYSYYNGIRSSRKMERECHRNLELMWLIGELKPDFKTIADFRRNNKAAIQKAFEKFSLICCELGLIRREIVAIDGSKFRASNSRNAYHSEAKIAKKLEVHRKSAKQYISLIETCDALETSNPVLSKDEIEKKLQWLGTRMRELETLQDTVRETGTIYDTDMDSRMMQANNNGIEISYNVQIAVEESNHLVVVAETTNQPTNTEQLYGIAVQAKDLLQAQPLTVIADKGYYSGKQFKLCSESGIVPIVSKAIHDSPNASKDYGKKAFRYDELQGGYICPQGHLLSPLKRRPTSKYKDHMRYCNFKACAECPVRDKCTTSKTSGRTIEDKPFSDYSRQVDKYTAANMKLYRRRTCLAEHPFGTVKRALEFSYFLTRGLESVRAETSLHFLIYNIKRIINILGEQGLRVRFDG